MNHKIIISLIITAFFSLKAFALKSERRISSHKIEKVTEIESPDVERGPSGVAQTLKMDKSSNFTVTRYEDHEKGVLCYVMMPKSRDEKSSISCLKK